MAGKFMAELPAFADLDVHEQTRISELDGS
jgi:hypothetical protein